MADVAINSDSADIPAVNFAQQGSDPTAPGASRWLLFFKSGGLYARKSDGTVVGPFGPTGAVATDPIWDAQGDIAVATGADTAARLAKGTALQIPRVKADGSTLEYATPRGFRVAQQVLGGDAASITFSSIPTFGTALELVLTGRTTNAGSSFQHILAQLNDDANGNYAWQNQYAAGTTVTAAHGENSTYVGVGWLPQASALANAPGSLRALFHNFRDTTFFKTVEASCSVCVSSASGGMIDVRESSIWRVTSAITKIVLAPSADSFLAGTTATLYVLL